MKCIVCRLEHILIPEDLQRNLSFFFDPVHTFFDLFKFVSLSDDHCLGERDAVF